MSALPRRVGAATGAADGVEKGGFVKTQKIAGLLFFHVSHQALINRFISEGLALHDPDRLAGLLTLHDGSELIKVVLSGSESRHL